MVSYSAPYLDAGCQAVKTNTFGLRRHVTRRAANPWPARQSLRGVCWPGRPPPPMGPMYSGTWDRWPLWRTRTRRRSAWPRPSSSSPRGSPISCWKPCSSNQGVADFARQLKALCPSAFLLVSFGVQPDGYTREGLSASRLYGQGCRPAKGWTPPASTACAAPSICFDKIRRLDAKDALLSAMPNAGYPTGLGPPGWYTGASRIALPSRAWPWFGRGLKSSGGAAAPPRPASRPPWSRPSAGKSPWPSRPRPSLPPTLPPLLGLPRAPWPPIPFGISWKPASGWWWWSWTPRPRAAPSPLWRPPLGSRPPARTGSPWRIVPLAAPGQQQPAPPAQAGTGHRAPAPPGLPGPEPKRHPGLAAGAFLEGIRNVLLVTGDPVAGGQEDMVKGVFQFNARKLASYVAAMNDTVFPNPPHGALNVNAKNFQIQTGPGKGGQWHPPS